MFSNTPDADRQRKHELKLKKIEHRGTIRGQEERESRSAYFIGALSILCVLAFFISLFYVLDPTPEESRLQHEEKILCIQEHGEWYSNQCSFDD